MKVRSFFFLLLYFKYGYLEIVFQVLPCIGNVLFSYRMKIPNSFALTTNVNKGSKFKFQQIEPKSTWLQLQRGNLSMYNRRVMPLCSKTLRKKTDPESLALFPTGPQQLNPATTTTTTATIWIRLLLLRYVFAASTRSRFDCTLFACSLVSRAHELMYSESNHCGALLYVNRRPWRR